MIKHKWFWAALPVLGLAGVAVAQYPVMDAVAGNVIAKYQGSTCEQLWQQTSQPKSPEEQRVVKFLQGDPALRKAFFDKVSGPIVNKMFECGMIP